MNPTWRLRDSTSNLLISKGISTSTVNFPTNALGTTATAEVDQKVHPEERVMLPPQHADKLLPWYHHWLNELAAKMH